jgi:hypothetical protein
MFDFLLGLFAGYWLLGCVIVFKRVRRERLKPSEWFIAAGVAAFWPWLRR